MNTTIPTEFPKRKPEAFPAVAVRGNATVKIYHMSSRVGDSDYDTFRIPYLESGVRKFHRFPDYDHARDKGNEMLEQLSNGDVSAITLKDSDKHIYLRALDIVRPFGVRLDTVAQQWADGITALNGCPVSLAEAARGHAKRHPAKFPDKTVVEVVSEFITDKKNRGKSIRYIEDLRHRLQYGFAKTHPGKIGNVDNGQLREYLDGLKVSARSRNNYLTSLVSLFRFAKSRKYLADDWNEFDGIAKSNDDGGDIEIFTPEELAKLFGCASRDLLPFLLIGAFAGLRSAEIDRLEWCDVNFQTGYITVARQKAKTKARRVVAMTDNLKKLLAPYAKSEGKVWPHGHAYLYEVLRAVSKAAKVEWKANALRHSFISYRVAETKNVNATSLEAGNTPEMIFKHYRELVTAEDAQRWFATVPEKPKRTKSRKIVSLADALKKRKLAPVHTVAAAR